MKIASLLICCISLLLLSSCHKITHGTVVDKQVEPAYMTEIFVPMLMGNGKSSTTILVPVIINFPEAYGIDVKGVDKKGITRVERFYVESTDFPRFNKGDLFTCGDAGYKECVNERPHTQKEKN